ncbi:MAG: tRNA (adenosine(37)-N6)-dimethylallyltransferase MiaA [Culicoidibacterales bacterium]
MKQVCVIVGPTASGKTQLSIQIAKCYDGEIINGDAMQVYKGMDIGTAKITEDEMENIPHHLFSFIEPAENYSIYKHQQYVRNIIDDISSRGKLPIIVGGSGLYVQSILYDYQLNQETVEIIDNPLESNESLWKQLETLDLESAQQIHPNNRKRVLRAIARAKSGYSKSEQESKSENYELLYDAFVIGIEVERKLLHQRIEQRVEKMIQAGLEQEVSTLFQNDVSDTARVAIGYREWLPYFSNDISITDVQEQITIHTRQLAKRQMTWFYNQRLPITWIKFPQDTINLHTQLEQWRK